MVPERRVRATTQAAEGLPRLKWTVAEIDRMVEAGIFQEGDRIELIGGELVPMSPKGVRHEIVRTRLLNWLVRRLPADVEIAVELGWRPDPDTYVEPDFMIYRAGFQAASAPPRAVHLVIEIAQSSLAYDLGVKALTYARLGIAEYWVVDANALATTVHRGPGVSGYGEIRRLGASDTLEPSGAPQPRSVSPTSESSR